jgi:hypothetical protein
MRHVYRRHKHIRVFRFLLYFAPPQACVNRHLASGYSVLGHLFGRVWNSVPRCAGTVCHSPIKYTPDFTHWKLCVIHPVTGVMHPVTHWETLDAYPILDILVPGVMTSL